jgi:lipoprotein-anchoring transpeptidase ErfK/SrfK
MNSDTTQADQAIQNSYSALREGNKPGARYWAQRAAWLDPDLEDSWLILATISTPTASVAYLERALKINPDSPYAAVRMHWAKARLEAGEKPAPGEPEELIIAHKNALRRRRAVARARKLLLFPALLAGVLALWLFAAWVIWPDAMPVAQAFILRASPTPAATLPPATPTQVITPLATATLPSLTTQTPVPTYTPSPIPTLTPIPTTPAPTPLNSSVPAAVSVSVSERGAGQLGVGKRVVVDISEQHLYAYEGDQLVYSFVASTGQDGGTLSGKFQVLDKIENAYSDPWGFWMPDWLGIYYVGSDLENGIHSLPVLQDGSKIWGNEIGKPITYGCVVLQPEDAKMLYNWVEIGTPVDIRR